MGVEFLEQIYVGNWIYMYCLRKKEDKPAQIAIQL